ncbi:MAG TPA: HEAT repeat domain-containing protein [Planctomycetota bacterium]|nr:HEAT repeat domain-containing protein [Planctomycetota bacterium]
MDNPPGSDLDLRKEIAADAAEPQETPSIFVRAGQFFLVPLAIVTACVAVYAFFQYMVSEPYAPRDLIGEIRTGGAVARKHASNHLVQVLFEQWRRDRLDRTLVDPLLALFIELPPNETPADPVTKAFAGESPAIRAIIARCLSYFRDARAVEPILDAMKDERSSDTLAAYFDALGGIGAPESAPALIKYLDHPSTVVKKYAAFNLAAVAAPKKEKKGEPKAAPATPAVPEAIPHLLRKLKDAGERDEVRWNAALGLAIFLGDPSGREVLLQMLDRAHLERIIGADKKEPNVRELVAHAMTQACHAAAELRDAAFKPALERAKEDPDMNVRAAARRAIGMIDTKKSG